MLFTVLSYLEQAATLTPHEVAIDDSQRAISFAELRAEAIKTANAMHAASIRPGDRIGICMEKTVEQAIAILGTLYAGAIFVPILPNLKADNIEHIVSHSGMALVIVDGDRLREVSAAPSRPKLWIGVHPRSGAAPNLPVLAGLRAPLSTQAPTFTRIADDPAAIIYSSGSTGRPKGITVSHRNLYDGAQIVARYTKATSEDRIAGVLSFNFDYGLNQLWQTLFLRCSLHLHEFLLPSNLFVFLHTKKITVLPVMPVIIANMFDPRLRGNTSFDFSHVRCVTTSGGPVSNSMIANLRDSFPAAEIFLMYGLTEAFRSTYLPPSELEHRPRSIGKAIPGVEILVLDETGKVCPPGVAGELVHRGGCMSLGYWHDEEANALRFHRHPDYHNQVLLYSGDSARTDEDGFLYFIGRKDQMIKTRGFRVSPTEIELVADRFEGLFATVAFGVENPTTTQDIALVYTPKTTAPVDQAALRLFLQESLPPHMVPRFFIEMPSFPTTGNQGKFDRKHVIAEARKIIQEKHHGGQDQP